MAYLIPGWEMDEKKKELYRQSVVSATMTRARALGVIHDPYQYTVRKIEPRDLGLRDWKITANPWIRTLNQLNCMGIYKLSALSLDPEARHIEFRKGITGSSVFFVADLSEMYAGLNVVKALYHSDLDVIRVTEELEGKSSGDLEKFMANKDLRCEAYLTEPVIYDPQDGVYIDVTPSCTDTLVIVGFIIEPAGVTVT